jgi:hypothetical protein
MAQQTADNLIQSYLEGGSLHTTPEPFALDVAKGNVTGTTGVNKFGRNIDVDTGSVEDIWDGGETWIQPTAARLHDIVSSDNGDIAAGAGARTVQVYGLDSAYGLQDEIVTMNGTAGTPTANTYTMIHRVIVRSAGGSAQNIGSITATAQTDDTITAAILAGNNQTLMAIYQVPANKTAYMTTIYADMQRNVTTGAANIFLKEKPDGEVFQTKFVRGIVGTGSSLNYEWGVPRQIAAKTIIKMAADVSSSNTDIAAGFDLILVDD